MARPMPFSMPGLPWAAAAHGALWPLWSSWKVRRRRLGKFPLCSDSSAELAESIRHLTGCLAEFEVPVLRTPQLHCSSAARIAYTIFQDALGGAFASVWLCRDKKLNLVALKVSMTQQCFRCNSRHAKMSRASIVRSCIEQKSSMCD